MTSLSDGNGAVGIARRPGGGVVRVAKFLTAISTWFWDGVDVQWANTNGQTSAVLRRDGNVAAMLTVTASTDGIDQVLWMMNPRRSWRCPPRPDSPTSQNSVLSGHSWRRQVGRGPHACDVSAASSRGTGRIGAATRAATCPVRACSTGMTMSCAGSPTPASEETSPRSTKVIVLWIVLSPAKPDEHIDRQSGLALFDAFALKEKTLHANAGKHKELSRFEADSAVRFFARYLGRALTSPALREGIGDRPPAGRRYRWRISSDPICTPIGRVGC